MRITHTSSVRTVCSKNIPPANPLLLRESEEQKSTCSCFHVIIEWLIREKGNISRLLTFDFSRNPESEEDSECNSLSMIVRQATNDFPFHQWMILHLWLREISFFSFSLLFVTTPHLAVINHTVVFGSKDDHPTSWNFSLDPIHRPTFRNFCAKIDTLRPTIGSHRAVKLFHRQHPVLSLVTTRESFLNPMDCVQKLLLTAIIRTSCSTRWLLVKTGLTCLRSENTAVWETGRKTTSCTLTPTGETCRGISVSLERSSGPEMRFSSKKQESHAFEVKILCCLEWTSRKRLPVPDCHQLPTLLQGLSSSLILVPDSVFLVHVKFLPGTGTTTTTTMRDWEKEAHHSVH